MRKPSEFIDQWGLLDKKYKPDGGDTGHREGMWFSLTGMMGHEHAFKWLEQRELQYKSVMKKIHPAPGVILRHSAPEYDASDWDRMSRDQFQPNIIAAGYWCKQELKNLTIGHLKRGFLFTNNVRRNGATKKNHGTEVAGEIRNYSWKMPDPTGPEIWGNFIRAHRAYLLWPLLLLFDLEMLLGSIRWRFFPKHNIAMNHTLSLLQAMDRLPTPLSWLSRKIMPVKNLVSLIEQHFKDFPDDMVFFAEMFHEAYLCIYTKKN